MTALRALPLLSVVPHAQEVGATLKRWLAAQGVSMAVIGAITTATLYFLDVKAALALTKALYVLIAYLVIQQSQCRWPPDFLR